MHFLGLNVMPIGISDAPNYLNSRNSMSPIGTGITFISWFYWENNGSDKIDFLLNINIREHTAIRRSVFRPYLL